MSKYRAYKGIPQNVFNEMRALTEQYDDWKEELRSCYGIRSPRLTDRPSGGCTTSPVEASGDRAIVLEGWIREIHETIWEVCPPEHQEKLLYAVTKNRGYTFMTLQKDWNISERDFRRYRYAYFRRLAEKRGRIKKVSLRGHKKGLN